MQQLHTSVRDLPAASARGVSPAAVQVRPEGERKQIQVGTFAWPPSCQLWARVYAYPFGH